MKREWVYPKNYEEAKNAQREMAELVSLRDGFSSFSTFAGADVSQIPFDPEKRIFAAAVLLSPPGCERIETKTREEKQEFPYIPGFLGFREAPVLVETIRALNTRPDLIMVDGHGISHPRGLGIASHLGVLLDIPTLGVAKTILVGRPAGPLGEKVGSTVPLIWKDRQIGMILRTKARCNPLIISCGHKISLETALSLIKGSLQGYKLPEPTRQAHIAANACRVISVAKALAKSALE